MKRLAATTVAAVSASLATAVGAGLDISPVNAAGSKSLVGTFKLDPGRYSGGKARGSYLRMVQPDGKPFPNPDSSARDRTYTLIRPGSDGGLVTGRTQRAPKPAFDRRGNALARRIMRPQAFTAIDFSAFTTSSPRIRLSGKRLSGDLRGFTAAWNKQNFSQGSSRVSGRYNSRTRRYVLTWKSRVRGGPFNGFTGTWHLEGTFRSR